MARCHGVLHVGLVCVLALCVRNCCWAHSLRAPLVRPQLRNANVSELSLGDILENGGPSIQELLQDF